MGEFKGVSEKFNMSLAQHDGSSDRVIVQIGLDGLKISSSGDNRALRSYELSHISRWQSRAGSLILYTRTPVDVEERQTTLTAGDHTVRSALDTLTCCCMQLAEILQSRQSDNAQETANNLHALVAGNGKKKTPLPSADEVEYWKNPDKAGWLQCQGEVMKSWRNRWFVLKQGYLFRFFNDRVTESAKPRGVVDLSKIQDVKVLPGRSNTIQLKTTSGGTVQYMASTETEVVEWVSALEAAVQRICKLAAGVEDEPAKPASKSAAGSAPAGIDAWMKQLDRNLQNASSSVSTSGQTGRSGAPNMNTMVNVVGYDAIAGGGGHTSSSQRDTYRDNSPYAGLNKQYSSGYSPIQGANIAGASAVSDLDLNYGGAMGGASSAPSSSHHHQPSSYLAPAPQYTNQQQPVNGGGYYGAPQQQHHQPSPYGGGAPMASVSLMDQMPQQQPAYPYFHHQPQQQQQQPAPMAQPAAPAGGGAPWQVHYTAEGRPYYYNAGTGVTQWDAPAGFA